MTLLFSSMLLGCGSSDSFVFSAPRNTLVPVPDAVKQIFDKPLYEDSVWGLRVVDTADGRVLIDEQASTSFFIGSVRKIFSVGLLAEEVGPEHTYDTPVFRQGSVDNAGVLDGDLILVASGDLTMGGRKNPDGSLAISDFDHNEANSLGNAVLTTPDPLAGYKDLARQVADSGVTQITGEVVIDDRLFVPFNFRDEFDVKPIFVNDNVVDLSISPGAVGGPANVVIRPLSSALAVVNSLQTGAAGSEFDLELDPELPDNIGTPGASAEVLGNLPVDFEPAFTGEFPLIQTFRITDPSNYARTVFIEALEAEGVQVDAATVAGNPVALLPAKDSYQQSNRLALLVGTPFGDLARYILKISYNIGADTSLLLLGLTQGVDNLNAALQQERQILTTEFGIPGDSFEFVDGSGGGPTKATNAAVTSMLIGLLNSPAADTFWEALPILAVDGSLGFVTNFTSDPSLAGAAGQVRAKTGTFAEGGASGIIVRGQAFGGFIDTRSGRRLAYQLVVNEVPVEGILELTEIFQDQGTISAILWRDL